MIKISLTWNEFSLLHLKHNHQHITHNKSDIVFLLGHRDNNGSSILGLESQNRTSYIIL